MSILRIAYINTIRYLKQPSILGMNFLLPIAFVFIFALDLNIFNENIPIGISSNVNIEDIISLDDSYLSIEYMSEKEGIELLKNRKILALYVFEDTFFTEINSGNRPKIEVYKISEDIGLNRFETNLEIFINDKLEIKLLSQDLLEKTNIEYMISDNTNYFSIFSIPLLLCYFMICATGFIAVDLFLLKKSKVIYRMLLSTTKDTHVILGLCISIFLLQGASYSLSICTLIIVSNIELNLIICILYFFSISFFSTALTLLSLNLVENETLTSSLFVTLGILLLFAGIIGVDHPHSPLQIPSQAKFFCMLSPLYWVADGIVNNKLFPNIIIIFLMGITLLTARKYYIQDFI